MRFAAVLVCLAALAATVPATPAAAEQPAGAAIAYRPPVDAPIVDHFRAPASPWGAGNRGIDYALRAATPVRAAAPGEVAFAGRVGWTLHVVVLHADGIRTSYSFLADVRVRRGDRVAAGGVVGLSGTTLHFGARAPDGTYLDPEALFGSGPPRYLLVPHRPFRLGSEARERVNVLAALGRRAWDGARGAGRAAGAAVGWARAGAGAATGWAGRQVSETLSGLKAQVDSLLLEARLWIHYLAALNPGSSVLALLDRFAEWWHQRARCTPAAVGRPRVPERRIAVLVGGLGSGSQATAIRGLDTRALGYARGDTMLFSYRGGTGPYTGADTLGDLRQSARHLRDLLMDLRQRHPGVPVDLIAHSQGGVVARLALGEEVDHLDPRLPPIRSLVTLGSPHQGADAATALAFVGNTTSGGAALTLLQHVGVTDGVVGPSTAQLAETSEVIRGLGGRPLPYGAHVTSIAAAGDLTVAAPRSHLEGADNVVLPLTGASAHTNLVRDPRTLREVALAVRGWPPTCVGFRAFAERAVLGEAVSFSEDGAGFLVGLAARRLDGRVGPRRPPVLLPGGQP